jgi:undecaprenyl-diphosphatase
VAGTGETPYGVVFAFYTSLRENILDFSSWLKAVVLGLVEGVTEFIPVSSTGHLILVGRWLAFEGDAETTFNIVIQLGAILAVLWLYRARVFGTLANWQSDGASRRLLINLIIAFVPAAVMGLLMHDFITERLFNPRVVAVSLVVGGIVMLVIERWRPTPTTEVVDDLSARAALGIGLAQVLSLIPGVSRSGATIMGAIALGTSRVAATEFSFFLAIPVMLAATGYELIGSIDLLSAEQLSMVAIGFVVSFASALVVVKALIGFVSRHTFVPFAWYRIVFGVILLAFYWG